MLWHRGLLLLAGVFFLPLAACAAPLEQVIVEGQDMPLTATLPAPTIALTLTANPAAVNDGNGGLQPGSATDPTVNENGQPEEEQPTAAPSMTPSPSPSPEPTLVPTSLPSATPCGTPGQVVTGQLQSDLAGLVTYRVYLPPCYTELGRTYPTLYMLPGNIHTDSIWDELGLDEAAEVGIRNKKYPPFLIAMVSGGSLANNTSGGPFSYETFVMEEFIPFIERTYCVWPYADGRAIGGLSRGGYWALEIAFRHAEAFGSTGGHSAALVDYNGGPAINPLQTGAENDLGDLRVYLDAGDDDWLMPSVKQLHDEMELVGRQHTWQLNEGRHEDAYWAAHVEEYLDWYVEPWLSAESGYLPCRAITADH